MQLVLARIEVVCDGTATSGAIGAVGVGPLAVELTGDTSRLGWAVTNRSDHPVRIRSVAAVFEVAGAVEPIRMFCHGYQSWSPCRVAVLGVDTDPSARARFEFVQAAYHADQHTVTAPDLLRSEWLTLLADRTGRAVLAGFVAGTDHDGTLWLRRRADHSELWAEAFLGDVLVQPGERRRLHDLVVEQAGDWRPTGLLDEWARTAGDASSARRDAPFQVGWCSWYQYFDAIDERALRANLVRAADWPFETFQVDDGYQVAIGDWLATNEKFAAGLPALADTIRAAGRRPGLWVAPFLVAPDSTLASTHPEWLARRGGEPLYAWWNPAWQGGRDGFMYALDTTNPEALSYLTALARALVEMGFSYLKLDFTFAPSVDGVWHNPSRTPAQRVRDGFVAIRQGAGDDAFILGCGVPLANVVGLVDGARIGQDVAPLWALEPSDEIVAGYLPVQPATRHAYTDTVARSFMHRRLWLNDPDCVMLRTTQTDLSAETSATWARTVGLSGGMVTVSDDLSLLDRSARALLDEVIEIGRVSDASARTGSPAVAADLLAADPPTTFTAVGHTLVVDPATGSSRLDGDR